MAKPRLFKFFLSFVVLCVVVGVMAIIGAWIVVRRGPSVPDHSTLVLRIGGELVETPPHDVLGQVTGGARAQTVRGYVDALRRAKTDPRIDSVLIIPTPVQSPFWGKVQEIRDAVVDFRKSGKRISAFLEYGGEREYYLASAAEKIYLVPTSSLDVAGLATYEVFLKGTLDKIGAQADFEKIGDYKTAPNQLNQTTFTPPHREMTESLTRDMYEQLVRGLAESRKKKVEDVRALIDEGPFLARDAQRVGLIDALAYEDQLDDHGAVSKSGTVEGELYGRARGRMQRRGAPRIAVLYVSGIINSGDSGFDPLNGAVAGSRQLVRAIQSARADNDVRAIVVRIDSPRRIEHRVRRDLARADGDEEREAIAPARRVDVRSRRLGRLLRRDGGTAHRRAAGNADRVNWNLRRQVRDRWHVGEIRREYRVGHHRAKRGHRIARPAVHRQRAPEASRADRAISTTASFRRWRRPERCLSSVSISSPGAESGQARRPASTGWSTRSAGSIVRSRSPKSVRASQPKPKSKS